MDGFKFYKPNMFRFLKNKEFSFEDYLVGLGYSKSTDCYFYNEYKKDDYKVIVAYNNNIGKKVNIYYKDCKFVSIRFLPNSKTMADMIFKSTEKAIKELF